MGEEVPRFVELADPTAPATAYKAGKSVIGYDEAHMLGANGTSPAGTHVEVLLHVVSGHVEELEIWGGAFTQGVSRGELPELKTLRHTAWTR